MCKVEESKNCNRSILFNDKNGKEIMIPLKMSGGEYYSQEDMFRIITENGYDIAEIKDPMIVMNKEDDTVYISDHAMMRLRKRLGFNRSAAFRMTRKAFDEGITKNRADGYLRTWIEGKLAHLPEGMDSDYRIYGQYAFIFNRNVLVTVYNMIQKESYKTCHERFRDKKYNRSRENAKIRRLAEEAC